MTVHQRIRTVAVCLALVLLSACSKESAPAAGGGGALMNRLPGNAVVFATFNMQDPGVERYIHSPAYRDYMRELEKSALIDESMKAGMDAYFKVLGALGLTPTEGVEIPYAELIFYAVPKGGSGLDGAAHYSMKSGNDARPMLAKVKEILASSGVKTQASTEAGFDQLAVQMFNGESSHPVMELYHDALGIDTMYLGASESMFSMATTKPLLERGFVTAQDDSKAVLERPAVRKAIDSVPSSEGDVGIAYTDLPAVAKAFGAPANEELPINDVAFKFNLRDGIGMRGAAIFVPRNDLHKKVFDALPGSSKGAALTGSPAGTAMALAIDSAALLRIARAGIPDPTDPQFKQTEDLLKTVETLAVGMRPSTVGSPYPDAYLVARSSDPAALLAQLNVLRQSIPLPDGMKWLSKESGGVKFDYIPTPFGVGAYIGASSDAVIVGTNEMILLDLAKPKGEAAVGLLASAAQQMKTPTVFSAYINYSPLTAILESTLMTVAAFAPNNPQLDPKSYGYMKKMGEVLIQIGYEPGVLHMNWMQKLPEK